jgi:hypothetical protein
MDTLSIIGVVSARPDGATSVAIGLAAVLSADRRVLVVDASDRPEVAPLLNLDESAGLHQLARRSRLAAVSVAELGVHAQWRDGLAVLAGTFLPPEQRLEITDQFIDELIAAAAVGFDHVVVDLGRPRASLPSSIARGNLLWVVAPTPLGLVALERSVGQLGLLDRDWWSSTGVVLNCIPARAWHGVDRFIEREYRTRVIGRLPAAPGLWESVEVSHSLDALCDPITELARHRRAHETEVLLTRRALNQLRRALFHEPPGIGRRALEGMRWRK